ncbi:hypothetical protein MtrunA17_Chr4g0039991 [Medicago truncatula]|uniref:Uncharacterized protein n=1 Tax=Medicago truncatula TaxID=3880 RepID=A0A072ULU5_MEDTR|nr:uncharacterized protein LOC25494439 [Medicago truncatula]KEH30677.1 hypothetical protein MTR_4g478210 [Medicago truncatula]RHN61748.1 hypothetical protein MtrunA17_Chr4g0039991 [Medicago truncatula]
MEKSEKEVSNSISISISKVGGVLCKRCKQTYNPASNSSTSCRFHPSFFVCRRHDDQKRYYELGPDDPPYAAKFYDCCGAEDPEATGCTTYFHVSYDED